MTKKGYFKKYEYVYDEKLDIYICPNNMYMTGGESHSVRYMRATTKPLVRATSSDKRASPYRLAS